MLPLTALVLSSLLTTQPCARCARSVLPRPPTPVMAFVGLERSALHHVLSGNLPSLAQQKFSVLLASAGALATTRATFWQLLAAFVFGTAFSTTIFAAEGLRNAFGTKNVQRAKRLISLVLKRCWRVTITMLVAACVALVQGVNECLDPDECEVPGSSRSRWAGALQILREGLVEARRTATEGFEAIKQEFRLYSAAVGQPGLVTLQHMMNPVAPP